MVFDKALFKQHIHEDSHLFNVYPSTPLTSTAVHPNPSVSDQDMVQG